MLESPIKIVSRPVVSAIDNSSSDKSIHCEYALGGRYTVQTRNGLEFGNENSDHRVSICEVSNSGPRMQLRESL